MFTNKWFSYKSDMFKNMSWTKTPFEKFDNNNELLSNSHYFPFCSNRTLIQSINHTNFFNEITENECRQMLQQLIKFDEDARKASKLFAIYMKAIDSASKENRYSIINADCQVRFFIFIFFINYFFMFYIASLSNMDLFSQNSILPSKSSYTTLPNDL